MSWQHYLKGLWWSGLRMAESLDLFWGDDRKLCLVAVDGKLMMKIPASLEKGNKDRLLAIAPEFSEFLLQTPVEERRGRVFELQASKVHGD